jgi:nucleoside phosphorylase
MTAPDEDHLNRLRNEIARLYLRSGKPSTRDLANEVGFSHTTVHLVLNCKALPNWGKLELVVESLGGDPENFRPLWIAARRATDQPEPAVPSNMRPTVGILVAHSLDARPFYSVISNSTPVAVNGDPNVYRTGFVTSTDPEQSHDVVVGILPRDNSRNAAAGCTDLIRSFPSVRCVLMTGVAAAVRDVRLGDVVVATDGILDYGHVRRVQGVASPRRQTDGVSAEMRRAFTVMRELAYSPETGREDWSRWLHPLGSVDVPGSPSEDQGPSRVHEGLIGSADILLRDDGERDRLAGQKVLAVEMEAAGVAAAAHSHGIEWFVVSGIADETTGRKVDEMWRPYARLVVARCVRGLLQHCRPFD